MLLYQRVAFFYSKICWYADLGSPLIGRELRRSHGNSVASSWRHFPPPKKVLNKSFSKIQVGENHGVYTVGIKMYTYRWYVFCRTSWWKGLVAGFTNNSDWFFVNFMQTSKFPGQPSKRYGRKSGESTNWNMFFQLVISPEPYCVA